MKKKPIPQIIYVGFLCLFVCSINSCNRRSYPVTSDEQSLDGYTRKPEATSNVSIFGSSRSDFDTTAVWHPERIIVVWLEMRLDILLPQENQHSGVANLFLRDRSSGEIRMLDYVKSDPIYSELTLRTLKNELPYESWPDPDSVQHYRYANHFEPGLYDAIVLYNNGRYIICEDISFEKGMQKVVDMTKLRPHKADDNSREWLKLRKFTDIVGKREPLYKSYTGTSPHIIIGYLFVHWGFADNIGSAYIYKYDQQERGSNTSYDGFFEINVDNNYETYLMKISGANFHGVYAAAQANTWIFAIPTPGGDDIYWDDIYGPLYKEEWNSTDSILISLQTNILKNIND
jgi:hypothetical protein